MVFERSGHFVNEEQTSFNYFVSTRQQHLDPLATAADDDAVSFASPDLGDVKLDLEGILFCFTHFPRQGYHPLFA